MREMLSGLDGPTMVWKWLSKRREPAGIVPQKRNGVAVNISHSELAKLFCGLARKRARLVQAFFYQGIIIHGCRSINDVHLLQQRRMRMAHVIQVPGVLRLTNSERLNGDEVPVCILKVLGESRCLICLLRE